MLRFRFELAEHNPKFLNYVKQHAFYASTKGSDKENLDDGIAYAIAVNIDATSKYSIFGN